MAFLFKLVAKPLLLVILSCQFGSQCICVVVQTLIQLLRAALYLHLVILLRSAIWVISIFSLPRRAFDSLYKQNMLHKQLQRVRTELEDVSRERKELEKQLHAAIKDCRMIDDMLTELENEHDDAIVKIELLGGEVRKLKDEIKRIKEGEDNEETGIYTKKNVNTRKSLPSRYGNISHDMSPEIVHNSDYMNELVKNQPKIQGPIKQQVPDAASKGKTLCGKQRLRDLALSRSLCSATLALMVGAIAWESKEPCMPLVLALFTVVAMSLWSVVKFFGTIQRKPTTYAVALLSLNWFMLGVLMYPTFPVFARVSSPLATRFLGRMFIWFAS